MITFISPCSTCDNQSGLKARCPSTGRNIPTVLEYDRMCGLPRPEGTNFQATLRAYISVYPCREAATRNAWRIEE